MPVMDVKKRFSYWRSLEAQQEQEMLCRELTKAPRIEVAEFLHEQSLPVAVRLFCSFEHDVQAALFEHFPVDYQVTFYQELKQAHFAQVFNRVSSDLRADFYLRLSEQERAELLPYLAKGVRQDVLTLSAYSPESAGGIMSTDFVAVHCDTTVSQALEQIRQEAPSGKMVYCLYVVDGDMRLVGSVDLKDLVLAAPETSMQQLADATPLYVSVGDDRELVANKISKYDLVALPVLNAHCQLVGVVGHEDAMDVLREEETEDMERFVGVLSDDQKGSYLDTSCFQHFRRRIGWVVGLFAIGFLTSFVVQRSEGMLKKWAFLVPFMPTLSDTGGNVCLQSTMIMVEGFATGQIALNQWWLVVRKELQVACMTSAVLFTLCLVKVQVFSWWYPAEAELPLSLSLIPALAVGLLVIVATLVGALFPFLLRLLGLDPAAASGVVVTTAMDVTGLLIYFALAHYFLV